MSHSDDSQGRALVASHCSLTHSPSNKAPLPPPCVAGKLQFPWARMQVLAEASFQMPNVRLLQELRRICFYYPTLAS